MESLLESWPSDFNEAKQIQLALAQKVDIQQHVLEPKLIAGVDVGLLDQGQTIRAVVTYHDATSAELLDYKVATEPCRFPYVPGYLSFRELPAVLKAFSEFNHRPDLVLCDGQGIAHPRGFGIACHLGVLLDLPTIGVAKSRLVGEFVEPGDARGSRTKLSYRGKIVGSVLRTRDKIKPLFVSPGHRITIEQSVDWVLKLGRGLKLPEPTRWADKIASNRNFK
ncbi:deoxyribonuclease V [Pleionea sediminis]|uniref:deoxyribonuclease V n=1 Tax=Pleionea sediminis TaxID=2569479 RepID=UPI001185F9FD|nr:deoxyribonuclease V [Pleionea sediminis]